MRIAEGGTELLQHLRNVVAATFCEDDDAGVEDQSHSGEVSGSRWLLTPSSTSRPKFPSSVTVEPWASASAIDSERGRPGPADSAGRTTATGRASISITISAPSRTRARTEAKFLVASASEMWMTSLGMGLLYMRGT